MIYVIVKHSEDPDDRPTNVFATTSKNVAEDKLAELEAYNAILIKASDELEAFAEAFEAQNAPQFPEGLLGDDDPIYKEWGTKYNAYNSIANDAIEQKTGEIAAKYWVRREELYSPYLGGWDHARYFIQEVESD